ncbi:aromatic ring-hydroxylating dioxygenase subunit alpha [Streptomyces muensis]|uniref:Aromatic ring-hydroxylating dioxygenase subunit alpha n=1 Tax=Streptomyces muensis TaxID=1077944 RepID=A0A9X1PVM0_STRM4|nr:aromatic ring-hydroxylating dioxygenase subunit alpha [Streptomyces muensis]MCF1592563.1 aromatic ring-hydroxylating dioxygenase subunit alpha [Streptomyces muensis]
MTAPTATAPQAAVTVPAEFRPATFALRDTWFPLVHSSDVRRRPVRRAMHGEPVILSRDGDRIRATDDLPGAPPALRRDGEFTGGTGEYPVVERYGYAWVWYGDPEHASADLLPSVPHIPIEGMPRRFQGSIVFDCTYELICENLLDLTHADFLHSKLTGDSLSEDDVVEVKSTSETVTMIRTAHGRPIPDMQKSLVGDAKTQDIRVVTITHVRSGVCLLHGDFMPGMDIRMLHPVNPESRTRARTPVTYDPQRMPGYARALFPYTAHLVGRQDNWAVRSQNDRYLQPGGQRDLSSRFDKAGLRYRRVYNELVTRQLAGDYSYLADGDPGRDVSEELGVTPGS